MDQLFAIPVLDITDKNARANSADLLAHAALKGTYLMLLSSGALRNGKFTPHPFLPPELARFFDILQIKERTYAELMTNLKSRHEVRQEIVKAARRNPFQFRDFVRSSSMYIHNPFLEQKTGQIRENLAPEEKNNLFLTVNLAYKIIAEVWRDVSLQLVGEGKYLLGMSDTGRFVARRVKEPPENVAAWMEWQGKWQLIAGHALSFFVLKAESLDKIVSENDSWSGVQAVSGYPLIADAAVEWAHLLRSGYANRRRPTSIPHRFPFTGKKGTYQSGQSIAEMTVLDLGNSSNGVLYKIRHTDGSIAVGRMYFNDAEQAFCFFQSNMPQALGETTDFSLVPFYGCGAVAAALARDMFVYETKARDSKRAYELSTHQPDGTTPSEHEVWLPLTRFTYNIDPQQSSKAGRSLRSLVRRELAPQHIEPHPLRLKPGYSPDPEKVAKADALDVRLEPGETFRKDHWRNLQNGEAPNLPDKTYKSRSAFALIFGARS
ncbi:hypothetical protein HYY73_06075 [Candidatus Woesearchaeota archaeon]|nr:hypothetical protein [Candidatus Woesearchaeota archaeon]